MRRMRGFTLLEVMLGLAILGFALTVLVRGAAVSMTGARGTELMGVATELSRSKMNDLEEMLLKEGFTETDQSEGECGDPKERVPLTSSSGGGDDASRNTDAIARDLDDRDRQIRDRAKSGEPFEEEGWPSITYTYKVEQVELPSWQEIQEMAQARDGSAGSGSQEAEGGFQNSALGGMLSQLGGFGGDGAADIDAVQGASFIQGQYALVQEVLQASIRKVTLCVYYESSGRPLELQTVAYFTDAAAMDKILGGLGSRDLDDEPTPGTGSAPPGPGSSRQPTTRTPTTRDGRK